MAGPERVVRKGVAVAGAVGAALSVASVAGSVGTASYLARRLLTPDRQRPDNVVILAVDESSITLATSVDTLSPGRYGLWLDQGRGHLRLGEILAVDELAGRVTRRLLGVDAGHPRPGPARWNGFFHGLPPAQSLGLPAQDAVIASDVGDLPAWVIRGAGVGDSDRCRRWAVLLHGRGGSRIECLRAVPALHQMRITTVVPAYRNDEGAPGSPDGRYNLGLSEWRDVEAAVRYALAHGAHDVVLVGWSMGAAMCLQMLDRSALADRVESLVLNGPVIDWGDVIAHHARLNKVPKPMSQLTRGLIGARWARRLVGVHEPLDVADTNWQHRADELRHRMLIIHSVDDDFVPVGPTRALARRRPDLVRLEEWTQARHTKEWNTDPKRWDFVITDFLTS